MDVLPEPAGLVVGAEAPIALDARSHDDETSDNRGSPTSTARVDAKTRMCMSPSMRSCGLIRRVPPVNRSAPEGRGQRAGSVQARNGFVCTFASSRCKTVHCGAFRCIWVRFAHSQKTSTYVNCGKPASTPVNRERTAIARFVAQRGCQRAHPTRQKTARLLLHPNRARFGQQSRTTARVSPEKRSKKFRILVTPFARFCTPSATYTNEEGATPPGAPSSGIYW